jgi:F-box domain
MHLALKPILRRLGILERSNPDRKGSTPGEFQQKKRHCFILDLPTELLQEIASHLGPVSAACLALTCKRLFVVSGAVLHLESLRFNRDFGPLFHHYKSSQSFTTDRWGLLVKLEDQKWRACSKCLKLHPPGAFLSKALRQKPENRTCNLGDLAGVVDLCPCKKLTFQDKVNLVTHLKAREHLAKVPNTVFGNRPRDPYRWHSCVATYGTTELRVDIFPELDETGRLLVRTEYHLYVEPCEQGTQPHITPRFGCPHQAVEVWLIGVCETSSCHFREAGCPECTRISICGSCGTMLTCPKKRASYCAKTQKALFSFNTLRCLGKTATVPDKQWAVQRAHPANHYPCEDGRHRSCPWTVRNHSEPAQTPYWAFSFIDPGPSDGVFLSHLHSSLFPATSPHRLRTSIWGGRG